MDIMNVEIDRALFAMLYTRFWISLGAEIDDMLRSHSSEFPSVLLIGVPQKSEVVIDGVEMSGDNLAREIRSSIERVYPVVVKYRVINRIWTLSDRRNVLAEISVDDMTGIDPAKLGLGNDRVQL